MQLETIEPFSKNYTSLCLDIACSFDSAYGGWLDSKIKLIWIYFDLYGLYKIFINII
jgi:hypothetical protein